LLINVRYKFSRADEAHHRQVNHTLGDLDHNQDNPYGPGQ